MQYSALRPQPISQPVIFRSRLYFVVLRSAIFTLFICSIPVSVVGHSGPLVSTFSVIITIALCIVIFWRLFRAKISVGDSEIISFGYFTNVHIENNQVQYADAEPTWYTWRRWIVPCSLHIVLKDGQKIRIPGVQAYIVNTGIVHNRVSLSLARSYPAQVAHAINKALLTHP
jgi:hypothetical protein